MSPKLQKEFFAVDFVGVVAKGQPINLQLDKNQLDTIHFSFYPFFIYCVKVEGFLNRELDRKTLFQNLRVRDEGSKLP